MTNNGDINIQEMQKALQETLERVQSLAAFLSLKQSEAMSGGEYTMISYMNAKQELEIEKSLLTGHANILQSTLKEQDHPPKHETKQLLQNARGFRCLSG